MIIAIALAANSRAQTLLVDTGQPTGTQGFILCAATCGGGSTFQNLAGQFTLTQANSISSAQAWVQAPSTGGKLAVVVRADNAGLPGISISSQTYTVPNQTASGWVTFTFANQPVLAANTPYWLSLEPVAGSLLSYNMKGGAPNPLAIYTLYNSLNPGPFVEALGLGMRISGTPAAGLTLLVDTGAGQIGQIGSLGLFNAGTNFEYIAGQFTLNQAASISSIQGWMLVLAAGSVNVKIYAGNSSLALAGIIPGTSVFSQTFTPGASSAMGWVSFPLSQPYPVLSAGTYWISFEPVASGFSAEMGPGVPNPLPNYAFFANGNNRWVNSHLNVGIQVFGTTLQALASGTAARTIMTGSAFGLPDTTQDLINGGDGSVNTSPWNFIIPSGWSFARGTITQNGLLAGAYSATSGPCNGGGTCGVGAGRGVAYRTWSNSGNTSLTFQVNAVLEGEFQYRGGAAAAGVYIFDTTSFTNALTASGLATPQFLLNSSTLTALSAGGASLASLIPSSGVLLNDFRVVTGPVNQLLNIPVTTQFVTVAPNQSITVMFDVLAYATDFGSANFASTLAPSPTLPLFTDASGHAVTQLVALGPSVTPAATPLSLVLTPPSASNPVGTAGSVTATVTDAGGSPIPNALVFFAFNSGPNAGPAGPVSTDANGQAVFTYTGNGGAGADVIQATLGTLTATPVSITWTVPGPLDHITISPASAMIPAGGSRSYTAMAFDRFNNPIGDVTAQTTFGIAPDGSCTGASCTASVLGPHTVTGNDSGKTAQASLTVNGSRTTPTITWATPAAVTYGTPLSAAQLNATANVPGSFVYTPGLGTVLGLGNQTLSVMFMPMDTTNYTGASAQVILVVNPAGVSAAFQPLDTTTQGNWPGHYGQDGYLIVNDVNSPPSYATLTPSGASTYTWVASSPESRALLKNPNTTDRIASTYYASNSFTFDLTLTGGMHQVALYLLDLDTFERAETISILDPNNGNATLDTRSFSGFHNGEYAIWNLQGHVLIRVTRTAGLNAVVSALFFRTLNPVNPPTVSISSPAPGTVTGPVTMTANVQSTVGIQSVQFLLDGNLFGSPVTGGSAGNYSIPWATPTATNGPHTVGAIALDTLGQSTTSASVSVTVSNSVPPPSGSVVFLRTDTATQGNWKNNYGADGELIANDSSHVPFYATVGLGTALQYTWASSTTSVRALTKYNSATDRIASAFYNTPSFTLDVNLVDNQPHQIALYFLDWDDNRAETVSILDANTNQVIDTHTLVSFGGGQYLVWNMQGHVLVKVQIVNGVSAVVSGIFFGTAGATAAPPTVSISAPGANAILSGTAPLTATASSTVGIASVQFLLDSTTNLGSPLTASPYTYLWNTLTVGNGPHTLTAIATDGLSQQTTSASVSVTVNNAPASTSATFVAKDMATEGTWKTHYGSDGEIVANDSNKPASYATPTFNGAATWTWVANTGDPRAAQQATGSGHIASTFYATNGFTLDVNPTDTNTHQLALYFLDWDNGGRAQTVSILDASTNTVLNTQTIANFQNGAYLVWNIKGHVTVQFSRTAGQNAVVSGVFLAP